MCNVFQVLLLEWNITIKGQKDENIRQMDFDASNNENREYKVETI